MSGFSYTHHRVFKTEIMEVPLNQKYTTVTNRQFKTLYFTLVRDPNGMIVEGIRLVEDIAGQPLPVTHDRPLDEIKQMISERRMLPVMSAE